ncbi:cbb3-type cytochrome oxidase assembly protein CcoS [Gilvibacter sp. SZ-19]|jgi:cbb3-type cytochrome oxidase maturation protein|uniref:cbb3-type cytochrome oxidase assembly protein CcoS n=1 Tax=unclassified Gilvibacter TaxID=2625242 RepID=UPI000B3CDA71|nr:cbb3-type cytochrome oxidase assembly protein CcoS [Gilvibacter sp. SZ-19]ARV12475.1 cytochrome oxidase maturation protein, cbb3-type [Gilvibacter sp. SZ-19]
MSIIFLLLSVSICVAIVFFIAFIISVKRGQYDDTYTPAVRMLFEDELVKERPETSTTTIKDSTNEQL